MDFEIPYPGPTVDTAFNTDCVAGCSGDGEGGPLCSCTAADVYWSSSTSRYAPANAWLVISGNGLSSNNNGKSIE